MRKFISTLLAIVDFRSARQNPEPWQWWIEREERRKWAEYDPLADLIEDAVEAATREKPGISLDPLAVRIDLAYEEYHYHK